MIDYDNHHYEMAMTCDRKDCNEQSQFYGTFRECITEAKEEGWKMTKLDEDQWLHVCPFCSEKETNPREVFK